MTQTIGYTEGAVSSGNTTMGYGRLNGEDLTVLESNQRLKSVWFLVDQHQTYPGSGSFHVALYEMDGDGTPNGSVQLLDIAVTMPAYSDDTVDPGEYTDGSDRWFKIGGLDYDLSAFAGKTVALAVGEAAPHGSIPIKRVGREATSRDGASEPTPLTNPWSGYSAADAYAIYVETETAVTTTPGIPSDTIQIANVPQANTDVTITVKAADGTELHSATITADASGQFPAIDLSATTAAVGDPLGSIEYRLATGENVTDYNAVVGSI